jgi:hypothetical protein
MRRLGYWRCVLTYHNATISRLRLSALRRKALVDFAAAALLPWQPEAT